jgi:hypothetical protein
MRKFLRSSGVMPDFEQIDPQLKHSCLGRLASSFTFLFIILALGVWLTLFVLYRDSLPADSDQGILSNNLTCIFFFGGLTLAIIVGNLGGNMLRRALWRLLLRRKK